MVDLPHKTPKGIEYRILDECGTIVHLDCQYVPGSGYTCYMGRKDPKTREMSRCGRLKLKGRSATFTPRD